MPLPNELKKFNKEVVYLKHISLKKNPEKLTTEY